MTSPSDAVRVLVADADRYAGATLVGALAVERDLEIGPPVERLDELLGDAPEVDVVLLVGDLGTEKGEAWLVAHREQSDPPWVVLTRGGGVVEDEVVDDVLRAGAHGCLVESSTPLQIGAALRAAARGDRSSPGSAVTGPLVQRVRREQAPLTERELVVLRLVASGLGNQAIADRLYLSVSSVKSHLSHTYGRLGVNHRTAAVAEARRQGLL